MRTDSTLGITATALALALCLLAPGVTARPGTQAPDAQAPGGQPTFRTGTRLATFDAVVTDAKGRHVTDLTPADFEVVERGKRQTVRQVAYVHAVRPDGAPSVNAGAGATRHRRLDLGFLQWVAFAFVDGIPDAYERRTRPPGGLSRDSGAC